MSETYAHIKIISNNTQSLERVKFYLETDTRPDFENEVPADEVEIFKAIEFSDLPTKIKQSSPNVIDAWFEFVELEDILDLFIAFDNFPSLTQYCFFSDDEEYKAYFIYRNGELIPIYTIEDDDEFDEKLWGLDWDERAFEEVIEKYNQI